MMGCHTCGGTVTGPVGTDPERAKESMFTPWVVVPTVEIWRIGPVFPEKKTLYPRVISIPVVSPSSENIALPVAFLTASPCQLPASRPAPSVHPRKGERQGKNPFLFAMLFEKNIETFFERQPFAAICLFLPPPAFPSVGVGDEWGCGWI